jgi:hypothetical protein
VGGDESELRNQLMTSVMKARETHRLSQSQGGA